jgi:hypothetical protein
MRAFLAWGLLVGLPIILCASANATTLHGGKPRHVIVGPARGATAPAQGQVAIPGWTEEETRQWLDRASEGWKHA